MSLVEIVLLAIALGVDCLVVSFSQGLIFHSNKLPNSLKLAFVMGLFQGLMPVIGYWCADAVNSYVEKFADWIVFIIFLILGIKFICEALKKSDDDVKICCIGLKCLISLGIATSIDALAVGITFAFLQVNILYAALIIGVTTFVISVIGVKIGHVFGLKYKSKAEIAGGIILIAMGCKILLEHLNIL